MKAVIAVSMGFYNNVRIKPGTQFMVPVGVNGKWFVDKDKAPEPVPVEPEPNTLSELTRRVGRPKKGVE